jgi:hypothetical protein
MPSIAINEFVKRQTKNSRFSYFDGTWEELIKLVQDNFNNQMKGYRDGIILIPVPSDRFYTSMCKIGKDSILESKFESRREGEEPIKRTVVKNGKKTLANFVKIVLYRHDVLLENNENSTDAEWEIISINASIVKNEPMHPMTMARNMLNKEGGTKAEYTGQQFAESLWFWKDYVLYEGDEINND